MTNPSIVFYYTYKHLEINKNGYARLAIYTILVLSRFFDIRGNLGNVKEKSTRKTCFSRKMKRLALRIYPAKFC